MRSTTNAAATFSNAFSPLSGCRGPLIAGLAGTLTFLAGCEDRNVSIPPTTSASQTQGSLPQSSVGVAFTIDGFSKTKVRDVQLTFPPGEYLVSLVEIGLKAQSGLDSLTGAEVRARQRFSITKPATIIDLKCPEFDASRRMIIISGRDSAGHDFQQFVFPLSSESVFQPEPSRP